VRGINAIPEKRVVRTKFNIDVFIMSYHSPVKPIKMIHSFRFSYICV